MLHVTAIMVLFLGSPVLYALRALGTITRAPRTTTRYSETQADNEGDTPCTR